MVRKANATLRPGRMSRAKQFEALIPENNSSQVELVTDQKASASSESPSS